MSDLHVITERADGPDLDDLVRLIRYCREHDIPHAVDGGSTKSFMAVSYTHLTLPTNREV